MIKNLIVSAFADEYSPNFDTQLDMLSKNGVGYIEPRFVGEKNISDITCHEAKEIAKKLSYYGIGVSSIGSPLGKIKLSDDFSAHMEKAARVFETANTLGAKNIRMFSFYSRQGATRAEFREEAIEKLGAMLDLADRHGVRLCHENEGRIYGESPEDCFDLLSHFGGRLRQVYDMGNFLLCGHDPYNESFKKLLPHIEYFHIKDAISAGAIVPPGKGKAYIKEILTDFAAQSKAPFFATLEPHLETFSGLNKLTNSTFNNPYKFESPEAAFLTALADFKKIVEEV